MQLHELQRLISRERLTKYLAASSGDLRNAISLYERNVLLSESLFGVLQNAEVLVRNAIHEQLVLKFERSDWFNSPDLLRPAEREMLQRAKNQLRKKGKPETPGRVIAELTMGFWAALLGKRYKNLLWNGVASQGFPHVKLSRKEVHSRIDMIRLLRNRVAHHEPIFDRNLQADLSLLLETAGWISPVGREWIKKQETMSSRLTS